eukprot:4009760-Alexandrium_andersonii.AAC.1
MTVPDHDGRGASRDPAWRSLVSQCVCVCAFRAWTLLKMHVMACSTAEGRGSPPCNVLARHAI